jgi:hypothetical protein
LSCIELNIFRFVDAKPEAATAGGTRMRKIIALLLFSFIALARGEASAAPSGLYGKSIVISWTEDRMQKKTGEANMSSAIRRDAFSVYVSSAGRLFNRMSREKTRMRKPGKARSKESDEVGGAESGSNARGVSFQGNTLVVVQQMGGGGGARRILVSFDGGYGSCTAQVITGRAAGTEMIVKRRKNQEIQSVKTGAASCSVTNGNVFAGD